MAQEAYDFARFENTQAATPTPARVQDGQTQTPLRSVKGGNTKRATRKAFLSAMQVVLAIAFMALAFALVQSEAQLTEYTQQIQVQTAALTAAKSEYSYLEATLNASINLDQVEKVAKEQGLVKLDESQVTYIRLEDEAVLTKAQSSFAQWQESVSGIWTRLLAYLDP